MTSSLQWIHPQSLRPPDVVKDVVWAFEQEHPDSVHQDNLKSDDVQLSFVRFSKSVVLRWKQAKREQTRFFVPVLYGMNGKVEKYFDADAVDRERKLVLEVEAGRAIVTTVPKDHFRHV